MTTSIRGLVVCAGSDVDSAEAFVSRNEGINRIYLSSKETPTPAMVRLRSEERLKIILYDHETNFAALVDNPRRMQDYVKEVPSRLDDFDGILLGWRAPGFDTLTGKDSASSMAEGIRYVSLIKEIHRMIAGAGKELAVVLPIAAAHVRRLLTVADEMKPHVSFFVLAAFDGDWISTHATHVSSLPTITAAFQAYSRVFRPEKIVLAIPTGVTVHEGCAGIDRPFKSKRTGGSDLRRTHTIVVRNVESGYMPLVEDEDRVLVFEDARSLESKRIFVEENRLAGSALVLSAGADIAEDAVALWEDVVPPLRTASLRAPPPEEDPVDTISSSSSSSSRTPPRPPFKCSRRKSSEHRRSYVFRSEWSPMDLYEKNDMVSIGKLQFICKHTHAPTFPLARPDLWEPLQDKLDW
jgi:hypothetical protein